MASIDQNYMNFLAQQQSNAYQAQLVQSLGGLGNLLGNSMGTPGMQAIAPSHFGQIRQMRKQFKELSKEDFRKMSNKPFIKDILIGSSKLNAEEIKDRIKENLDNVL